VHLLFAYLPPNLTAESAQLRVSRERPIAQAHPEAEILLRIRRMLHAVLRSGAELFGSSECACNQMGR
jgi:hypothetical protein